MAEAGPRRRCVARAAPNRRDVWAAVGYDGVAETPGHICLAEVMPGRRRSTRAAPAAEMCGPRQAMMVWKGLKAKIVRQRLHLVAV